MKIFRADKAESWPELEKGCACCKIIVVAGAGASGGTALGCGTPILLSHLVLLASSPSPAPFPAHMANVEQRA